MSGKVASDAHSEQDSREVKTQPPRRLTKKEHGLSQEELEQKRCVADVLPLTFDTEEDQSISSHRAPYENMPIAQENSDAKGHQTNRLLRATSLRLFEKSPCNELLRGWRPTKATMRPCTSRVQSVLTKKAFVRCHGQRLEV